MPRADIPNAKVFIKKYRLLDNHFVIVILWEDKVWDAWVAIDYRRARIQLNDVKTMLSHYRISMYYGAQRCKLTNSWGFLWMPVNEKIDSGEWK